MRVLLRCDSTKTQGLGHVVRCVAIGEAAREAGWDVIAAGDVESPLGRRLIDGIADEVFSRPSDARALARLARRERADVVHVDTYDDEGPVRDELSAVRVLLSSIEDGQYGQRPADLAVDPSAGAEFARRLEDGTRRLARGAQFIPVRSLVRGLREAVSEGSKNDGGRLSVVIVMGGTDARDATLALIRVWVKAGVPSLCTAVVAGEQAIDIGPLPSGLSLEFVQQSIELPRLFAAADVVISGAGTTIWELATLGVPMAITQLVENQKQNYAFAVEHGMAAGLGVPDGDEDAAALTLRRFLTDARSRDEVSAKAKSIVDGEGALRIVALWEELVSNPLGVTVRSATLSDASPLFTWRNDPSVRAASRSTGELRWDSHVEWLDRTLERDDVKLFIAEAGGHAAGTVRFDAEGPHDWEVSITLAPRARGTGIARDVLTAAEDRFRRDHPLATLCAVMRASNEPSYRLFRGAGYSGGLDETAGADDGAWYRLVKTAVPRG